jgi:manganese-dependent inorganic pyrophosphatase
MEKIYVIGHKSPDLDSVVAAITYAILKNQLENTDKYVPSIAGKQNKVTAFVLEKFGFELPEILEDARNKNLILVDHNEVSQRVDGGEEANILEVLDHHKINFNFSDPICFQSCPWGSTTSIIYRKFKINNLKIDKNLAGLMLSAILDDTVIAKSPTCTDKDREFIAELAKMAEIENWQDYGIKMFKAKSSVSDLSAEEIIKLDFKENDFKAGKFGFGQLETVDLNEFKEREEELLKYLKKIFKEENYHTVALFITDIIQEGSRVLICSQDMEGCEKALDQKIENNTGFVPGLVSRKKQVIPRFSDVFDK